MFFQRAEIWGFSVMIDYWPRRLDLAALKAGNLAEVGLLACHHDCATPCKDRLSHMVLPVACMAHDRPRQHDSYAL